MLRPRESASAITPRRAAPTCRCWCVALTSVAAILGCGEDPAVGGKVLGLPDGGLVDSPSVPADAGDSGADASEGDPPFSGPLNLSETGLFSDTPSQTLASGVLAYDVRYPLWSDGSEKKRYVLLPSGTQIDTSNMDVWSFPVGTKGMEGVPRRRQAARDPLLVEAGRGRRWLAPGRLRLECSRDGRSGCP